MKQRSFSILVVVTGCNNCPYCTDEIWCTKGDYETPEEYIKIFKENQFFVTQSCPMYKESK